KQWAEGETCRDLLEDKGWLKTLAFPAPDAPAMTDEAEEKVQRTYEVEVSGKRFDVRVLGVPFAAGAGAGTGAAAPVNGAVGATGRRAPKRAADRRSAGKGSSGG